MKIKFNEYVRTEIIKEYWLREHPPLNHSIGGVDYVFHKRGGKT